MISLYSPKKLKEQVFELSENHIRTAEKSSFFYEAKDDCILMAMGNSKVRVATGRDVLDHILFPKIIQFAEHHGVKIEIVECANLNHLKNLDKQVYFYNKVFDNSS